MLINGVGFGSESYFNFYVFKESKIRTRKAKSAPPPDPKKKKGT